MKKLNTRASYKLYKTRVAEPRPESEYVDIAHEFNRFLIGKALEGHEVTLPGRLGTLSVIGRRSVPRIDKETGELKGLAPDWVKTKELWNKDEEAKKNKTLVYHFNEETNGIRYSYHWSKVKVIVANKMAYSLRMTRENKRALSDLAKKGKEYQIKN